MKYVKCITIWWIYEQEFGAKFLAHPVGQYRLVKFINTESLSKTKRNLTSEWAKKLNSKLLFRSSPNTDGFYTFYISQGSVATQLRCGGMFSNHFTTNCSQNAPVKKFWKSVYICQRYGQNFVAYFFGPPCTFKSQIFPFADGPLFCYSGWPLFDAH